MLQIVRVFLVSLTVLLYACGGGGGSSSGGGGTNPPPGTTSSAQSSSPSLSSSSFSLSSSSSSLSAISLPNLPTGTVTALPVLNLNTDSGSPVVSKELYVKGSFSLVSEGAARIDGLLELRGRGNSTWSWPKKPYRLKLSNSTSLLGMPPSKNWVLLANYADKTLMRNDIAFMLGTSLPMAYTPRTQYVDLNVNGVYQGVYQLAEHIRVDKNRVNIPEMKVTDTDPKNITGGYLMEIDFRLHKDYCKDPFTQSFTPACVGEVNTQRDIDFCLDSTHGMSPFCLASPDTLHEPAWSAQRAYIQKYFADTEAALFSDNFTDPNVGYAAYLDVDSTIDYYIINELFKNVDGAVASAYLYKKREGKLFFGPIWDFDLALGNAGYNEVDKTYGWHIRQATWFARLFQDPVFEAKVKQRWKTLKANGNIEYIFTYAKARSIWLGKAQEKNFNLWQIFFWQEWYTRIIMGSYSGEVNEMIRWQRERMMWMDTELSK